MIPPPAPPRRRRGRMPRHGAIILLRQLMSLICVTTAQRKCPLSRRGAQGVG